MIHEMDNQLSSLVIELKTVEAILPVPKAQVIGYHRLLNLKFRLLINYNESRLVDGLSRLVNPNYNSASPAASC